jgi:hypothetical protein
MSLPTTYNLLAQYPNEYYVETGIWRGDSIQLALEAGFKNIIGIENDESCIEFCVSRFDLGRMPKDKSVSIELVHGDSATAMYQQIYEIPHRITFFLDSHWQFFEGTDPGPNPFPLLKELAQIQNHFIKDHTIIIDDWHIFYEDRVGYSKEDVLNALRAINPNFHFKFVANPVIDGVLIASV